MDMERQSQREGWPDVLVLGGDFAFDGRDYSEAERWMDAFLRPYRDRGCRLLMLPGNHDVDRSRVTDGVRNVQEAFFRGDEKSLERKVAKAFENQDELNFLLSRLQPFLRFRDRHLPGMEPNPWMYERFVKGDLPVELLGLCTAWLSHRAGEDSDRSLALSAYQVKKVLPRDSASLRIAAMHHPFSCLHPWDHQARTLLERDVDLLLCGHRHSSDPEIAGRCLVLQEACGYQGSRELNAWSGIVIEGSLAALRLTSRVRRWDPKSQKWEKTPERVWTRAEGAPWSTF